MPSKKPKPPKRIFVRFLASGKISVGEYLNAKWRNVVDPFKPDDKEAGKAFFALVEDFKKHEGRDVEYEPKDSQGLPKLMQLGQSIRNDETGYDPTKPAELPYGVQ